jgi:hypothetical protein
MMSKSRIKSVILMILCSLAALRVFAVVYTKLTINLELNLVDERTTGSEVVLRYEINNRGDSVWTCDPTKFTITFSDGTSSQAAPDVSETFTFESGGTACGLLSARISSPDIAVVGLSYDDGKVRLTNG